MPYRSLTFFFFLFFAFLTFAPPALAIEDPLAKPNNKIGIHILFPSEISEATKLINSNGGDWGYVTIPFASTDRDLKTWQQFMNNCRKLHVIPIIRLATTNDPNDTSVWKKPMLNDVIEAATFLHKLDWPTKNRYIIVYNEVNRSDEWGGEINPAEYANILSFAVSVFKSKSPDYFIISAGLDNAAPNKGVEYMDHHEYMKKMDEADPAIFYQVDGLGTHSYPNPAFSQPPRKENKVGVATFVYERELAHKLTGKMLPVFITETGWSSENVKEEQKIAYYKETFETVWNDPGIVAITPFLLDARFGDFQQFSFLSATGSGTKQYAFFKDLTKIKGDPIMPVKVLAAEIVKEKPPITTDEKKSLWQEIVLRVVKLFNS